MVQRKEFPTLDDATAIESLSFSLKETVRDIYVRISDPTAPDTYLIDRDIDTRSLQQLESLTLEIKTLEQRISEGGLLTTALKRSIATQLDSIFHVQRPVREVSEGELAPIKEKLKAFPSRFEGLNMDRVKSFLENRDYAVGIVVAFYEDEGSEIKKILGEYSYVADELMGVGTGDSLAVYAGLFDMVFVVRKREGEDPRFIEKLIVHELGHASSAYKNRYDVCFPYLLYSAGRTGFASDNMRSLKRRGVFFEEGFVESLAAEYKIENPPEGYNEEMLEQFGVTSIEVPAIDFKLGDYSIKLPLRYVDSSTGRIIVPALAAYGVDLLSQKIPELRDTMQRARAGDTNALRTVPRLLNSVYPGLYEILNTLSYRDNGEDFVKGTQLILDVLNR